MHAAAQSFESEYVHPIDIVESLAEHRSWDFDRICEDRIAMAVEGVWRSYAITLNWSPHDETLRLICTFEFKAEPERAADMALTLAGANDACWTGGFTLWAEQELMVYRYGLTLAGGAMATGGQIDAMMRAAVGACERFYPAFQLVAAGDAAPQEAVDVAVADAYGRA
jgi:hypothetical protein